MVLFEKIGSLFNEKIYFEYSHFLFQLVQYFSAKLQFLAEHFLLGT